jgi:hypothetical protein
MKNIQPTLSRYRLYSEHGYDYFYALSLEDAQRIALNWKKMEVSLSN